MQRLMQALGAYGYLGLVQGKSAFLAHTPTALCSLGEIVAGSKGLDRLQAQLESLRPAR